MERTFDVSEPVELEVRLASGEIEIEQVAGLTRAEVKLIAHDEESQQLVDRAQIELRDHPGHPQLIVDVPQRRSGFSLGVLLGRGGITCQVRVPESSGVSVRAKSADVSVRGTCGAVSVQTASGDVTVQDVDGSFSVKSASGDVFAREVSANADVHTASGDVQIDTVRGRVNVQAVSGDVTIGAADSDVNVNTVSGDQSHGAVQRGKVAAHSVSGDVQIGVRRGSKVFLDCNTVSGDTSSELEITPDAPGGSGPLVEIRAKTVSGDIRIVRAPAPAAAAVATSDAQEVHT